MAIDYTSATFWANLAQWAFNIIVAGYLWLSRKYRATSGQIIENEKEIMRLRADFNALPNRKEFVDLGKEIKSLTKELGETKGRLEGINRAVDLINEHLINKN